MSEIEFKDKIERINTDELIPYHNNPKEHPEEQINKLASSIKNYGFLVPLVVDSSDEVVAGHGRLEAAKKLGLDELPVIRADHLSEAQVKAFRLADNRVSESGWDYDSLGIELDELEQDFDYDVSGIGFSDDELNEIMDNRAVINDEGQDDDHSNAYENRLEDVDPEKFDKYLVSFSGGKDSAAAALKTINRFGNDDTILLYWDSGWNFRLEDKYVAYFADKYEVDTVVCGKSDRKKIDKLVKENGFPFYGNMWCRDRLKIHDIKEGKQYVQENFTENYLDTLGIRQDESNRRSDYPEFFEKDDGDIAWCPIRGMEEDDIIDFFKEEEEKINPLYNHMNRTGCVFCPNAGVLSRQYLKNRRQNDLIRVNELLEKSLKVYEWKHKFEDLFKFFNKERDPNKNPKYSEVALNPDKLKNYSLKNSEYIIDIRE